MSQTPEMPTVVVYVRGGLVQDVAIDGLARVVVLDFDGDNEDEQSLRYVHPNLDGTGGDTERCEGWMDIGPTGPGKNDPYVTAAINALATREEARDDIPIDPVLDAWLAERQPRAEVQP